jgi:hypothetical protein
MSPMWHWSQMNVSYLLTNDGPTLFTILKREAEFCGRPLKDATSPNVLTYLLTSWCRILFEKLIVTHPGKKYSAFL